MKVTIKDSATLREARLEDLIGRTGEITDACYGKDGKIRGAWIRLDGEPFMGEEEWFIPQNSYDYNDETN